MPSPEFKNFDPAHYQLLFNGLQISGYASGTFIQIERNTDSFSMRVGALGDVTRVRSRDRTARATVTLMQESPINAALSAMLSADEETGLIYGTLVLQTLNSTTVLEAGNAWIAKMPAAEGNTDGSDTEWLFDCAELVGSLNGAIL